MMWYVRLLTDMQLLCFLMGKLPTMQRATSRVCLMPGMLPIMTCFWLNLGYMQSQQDSLTLDVLTSSVSKEQQTSLARQHKIAETCDQRPVAGVKPDASWWLTVLRPSVSHSLKTLEEQSSLPLWGQGLGGGMGLVGHCGAVPGCWRLQWPVQWPGGTAPGLSGSAHALEPPALHAPLPTARPVPACFTLACANFFHKVQRWVMLGHQGHKAYASICLKCLPIIHNKTQDECRWHKVKPAGALSYSWQP